MIHIDMRHAAWRIKDGHPIRIDPSEVGIERDLENWIVDDPSLVMEGLRIVGRQVALEAGRLDLLGWDSAGRWVVIEIKAGALHRETVAQGLDYAASLKTLPSDRLRTIVTDYEGRTAPAAGSRQSPDDSVWTRDETPREVTVIVVGTDADPGLNRVTNYLSAFGVPIRAVSFQVLDLGGGQRMLTRAVTEADEAPVPPALDLRPRIDALLKRADSIGVGTAVRTIYDEATDLGLFVRPYPNSIMFTPPEHRNRALFTVWPQPRRNFWAGVDIFAEFYSVTLDQARALLGDQGWRQLTVQTAAEYASGLRSLLAR